MTNVNIEKKPSRYKNIKLFTTIFDLSDFYHYFVKRKTNSSYLITQDCYQIVVACPKFVPSILND
ncbi:hypothetical protein DERF_002101 [Dermatophagoides farinae]|uniref:Uncharacterized protein n=1 Tax=Dermatophagoides farinae TaxID=6954 RepID=A0A922L9A9_DERFA|nr:hypothetical protein DERF_002101 [Dermatophagoides farinae]